MTVSLYKFTGSNIMVDKSSALGTPTQVSADYGFEGNQSLEAPSIIIESQAEPDYNYCYIDSFSRYYYITGKVWLSGSLWRLNLFVDPLYTYKSDILNQSGIVMYSGLGDNKKYDPRLVYNDAPTKTEITALQSSVYPEDGGDIWIVLGCRYFFFPIFLDQFSDKINNSMSYIAFSPAAYSGFLTEFSDPTSTSGWREAISHCIVSASLVRYLNLKKITIPHWKTQQPSTGPYPEVVYFSSPEIYRGWQSSYETDPTGLAVLTWDHYDEQPNPLPAVYQFTNEQVKDPYLIYFRDTATNYSARKAQRVIEIPYIGKINIDLDTLGVPLSVTDFWIGCEIRYDFGGGEYIVTPFWADHEGTSERFPDESDIVYCRDAMIAVPNNYNIGYVSDDTYQYQSETRSAELLGLISTVAMGIVSGVATSGASVPLTAASLGMGVANMALTEQKLQYQEAASFTQKGSSNGGSAYDTLIKMLGSTTIRPKCKLYKQETESATDLTSFTAAYGKPDGEFRILSSLVNTGFAQLGTVYLTGLEGATNAEKNEIKDALLSGVIL